MQLDLTLIAKMPYNKGREKALSPETIAIYLDISQRRFACSKRSI